jgi:diguanylate cyclase (GGDEF)-like protein
MLGNVHTIFAPHRRAAPASEPPVPPATHSIHLRRLWWAAIMLLSLAASAVGWTIWQLRTGAVQAAVSETGNIATVLAGQLSRSLQAIDAVLLEVKRSTKGQEFDSRAGIRAALETRAFHDSLMGYLAHLPQAFNIAVADKDGQVVVSTAGWPTPDINIADRDYFQDARARTDGQLSTSIPIRNRVDRNRTIVFARRLESATGIFDGIIYASVNTKYLEDIYVSIQSVHSLIFTFLKPDGTILFRHPDVKDSAGRQLSDQIDWLNALSRNGETFRVLAQTDGNIRFVSVRRLPEYPLIVDISVTERTALAGWRQQSAIIGMGSSTLLLCSIYLLIAMTRQVRYLSRSEASLERKSEQLDTALNNMSHGLTMFDGQKRLIVCNEQFAAIYGLSPEQTKAGTSLHTILEARVAAASAPENVPNFVASRLEQVSQHNSTYTINELCDGRFVSVTHHPMQDGGWVAIHQDITAQKRVEMELEHLARYDALTGLVNRTLFMEKANEALAHTQLVGEEFSVLMLDLDRFKAVNDSLGHPAGDALLKEVATRLRRTARDVDSVARFGGDEFAVLQAPTQNQKNEVINLADRILRAITEPYDLDGRKIILETSIGIALGSRDGSDAESLIKNADLALYKAKSKGRNQYRFFEASMEAEARAHLELEDDMRRAITRNEFELHYQTIVDLGSLECCAAEALARWRHPKRGLIPPEQFIPLAEESGLIIPLGDWILRQACAAAVQWPSHLKVAVNLSPAQFKQIDLLGILASTLNDTGLPPHRLELEITETVLLENNEVNLAVLHKIKDLGISIVLDDFGIGYSSMRYLQMFPFDRIKIDRSFIQNIAHHAAGAAIVSAIAGLGRSLDMATTAEGVETVEQLAFSRTAGCQLAQGYLFSRPVPASDLTFDPPVMLRHGTKAA